MISRLPSELIYEILDLLSPPSWEWPENRYEIKWFVRLRLVCKRLDRAIIPWILASMNRRFDFQFLPLTDPIATPSAALMGRRLVSEQVYRDQTAGGSRLNEINQILAGVDAAIDILDHQHQDHPHRQDLQSLRRAHTDSLITTAIASVGVRGTLQDLAEGDSTVTDELVYSGNRSVALVAAASLGRVSDMKLIETSGGDLEWDEESWLCPPFLAAAYTGQLDAMKFLIDRGVDPNRKIGGTGDTALHYAAKAGQEETTQFLLDLGVEPDIQNESQETPLLCAAAAGHGSIVRLLLAQNINVNVEDVSGRTALLWAATKGAVSAVQQLLEREDLDVGSADGQHFMQNPTMMAALNGHEEVFRLLLSHPKVDIHATDESGFTCLKHAVYGGKESIVHMLLQTPGLDLNNRGGPQGTTPLMWAAKEGHERIARMLLAQDGIQINLRGEGTGATALVAAVMHDQVEVVRCLLEEQSILVNEPTEYEDDDCEGGNPLTLAALSGNEEILRLLLNHPDIDVEYQDVYGRSALNNAAGCDHANVVRLLLERDCIDVNTRDNAGRTPLITAVLGGCEQSIGVLLNDARTNTLCCDENEQTALELAAINGREDIVTMFLRSNRELPKASIEEGLGELKRFNDTPRDSVNKLLHRGLDEEVEGNLDRANEHYLKAIELAKQTLGADEEVTLNGQIFLATNYRKQYRHKEAEPLDRDVLERQQRTLGEKHEDTIITMGNLALDLKGQGRVDEAIPLQEKAAHLMMDVMGMDSESAIERVSDLANSYAAMRWYHNAAELHQKVLGWRKHNLGKEHAMTIIAMDLLGIDYRGLGQLDLALKLQEEAVKLAKVQMDTMHKTTITCVFNLADTYKALDKEEHGGSSQRTGTHKAIEVLEEYLPVIQNKGDNGNPLFVGIMNNLAVAYMSVDRLREAQELLQSCHTWNEATLGDDHPRTATTRQNLDLVLEKLGENFGD